MLGWSLESAVDLVELYEYVPVPELYFDGLFDELAKENDFPCCCCCCWFGVIKLNAGLFDSE